MNEDKWINVDPRTKKLSIRFRVRGFSSQFFISTGLKDTKRNREIVRTKREAIQTDILLGRFDHTLESYQFRASSKAESKAAKSKAKKPDYDLLQLWQKFTDYQETQLEQTTILDRYVYITKYCKRLPTLSLDKASEIRDWIVANSGNFMARLILGYFDNCCKWAVDSRLITDNPFATLTLAKLKTRVKDDEIQAFTLEQRDIIIQAFETHRQYSHYAPLIKFLFWTGCRPGEAFALTWNDISDDCCKITINKSCNKYKIRSYALTKNSIHVY